MRRAGSTSRSIWPAGSLDAASINSESSGDKGLPSGQGSEEAGFLEEIWLLLVLSVLLLGFMSAPRFLVFCRGWLYQLAMHLLTV
ncbi:hypothetical protein D7V86_23790 [bacterium D16-51]|nr:hypothetical protein D7V96_22125 [bacterium D16-59]RKI54308.1 hypothetical protein D7V86_23790 [bacterium D16-51]